MLKYTFRCLFCLNNLCVPFICFLAILPFVTHSNSTRIQSSIANTILKIITGKIVLLCCSMKLIKSKITIGKDRIHEIIQSVFLYSYHICCSRLCYRTSKTCHSLKGKTITLSLKLYIPKVTNLLRTEYKYIIQSLAHL